MSGKDDDRNEAGSSTKGGKKAAVFICEICRSQGLEARYSRVEYLNRHERTHSETKPFQCEYCEKRYARSDVLFRHRRKCALLQPNGGTSADAPPDDEPTVTSVRGKARQDARPYPALDTAGAGSSSSSSRRVRQQPGTELDQSSTECLGSGNGDSPPDSEISSRPVPTLADVLPPLDDATLLATATRFYGTTQGVAGSSSSQFMSGPPFPPTGGPALLTSAPKLNRFGGSNPLPWELEDWNDFAEEPLADNLIVPEQNMLHKELELCRKQCGTQKLDITNPFYFDPNRMMYCYMVPKWNMPPASKMSALAYRTYNHILEHLGVFHMPTFRLNEAHIWVSFAMCTSNSSDPKMRKTSATNVGDTPEIQRDLEELDANGEWMKSQKLIQKEKTDLIVRAIYNSAKLTKLVPEEALPLIHALLLYNSLSFLSEDQSERLAGQAYLSTITMVARNSGLFHPGSDCVSPGMAPTKDWGLYWKQWVTHESWRRTAWLVYTLDTLASLDTGAAVTIPTRDIWHIPLPYNNTLWHAPTAETWCEGMMDFGLAGITLDEAMICFSVPTPSDHGIPLYKRMIGPYARHVIVLTILRGIIAYGLGKPKGGYITKRWVLPNILVGGQHLEPDAMHSAVISQYGLMLDNWRVGWDLDMNCHPNYRGMHFVNDALPPYWLCRALLDRLTPPPPVHVPSVVQCEDEIAFDEDGPNRLYEVHLREMLTISRQFVSHGEGLGLPPQMAMPEPGGPMPFSDPFNIGAWTA